MNKLKSIIWTSFVITIMLGCSIICSAEELETTVPEVETTTVVEETTTVEPETTTVYVKGNIDAYIKNVDKKKMTVSVSTYHKKSLKKIKVGGYQIKVYQYGKKKEVATKNFGVTKKTNKITIKKKFKENTAYFCKIRYYQKSGKKKVYSKWKKTQAYVNINAKKLNYKASIEDGKLTIEFDNIKGTTGWVDIASPSLVAKYKKDLNYSAFYVMKKSSKKRRKCICYSIDSDSKWGVEKITTNQVYGIMIDTSGGNSTCYFDSKGNVLTEKQYRKLVWGY